jgi:hypothetical protein
VKSPGVFIGVCYRAERADVEVVVVFFSSYQEFWIAKDKNERAENHPELYPKHESSRHKRVFSIRRLGTHSYGMILQIRRMGQPVTICLMVSCDGDLNPVV